MKKPVKIKNKSIEGSVLKDYQKALCEYVLNGFEANAKNIKLSYETNALSGIEKIVISDDGNGINYNNLDDTFGSFMTSVKNLQKSPDKYSENQGKGRFAIFNFADKIIWNTRYKESDDKIYNFKISISNSDKVNYDIISEKSEVLDKNATTGTEVSCYGIKNLKLEDLSYKSLMGTLLKKFSWFLYIFPDRNIYINGEKLKYDDYINSDLSINREVKIDNSNFNICTIVWKEKIDEKFLIYYVNSEDNKIINVTTTTYNKNAVGFYHSVYVKSAYFETIKDLFVSDDEQISINEPQNFKKIIRTLKAEIYNDIENAYNKFLQSQASNYMNKAEKRNSFPKFQSGYYGELEKKDFKKVVETIYVTEPKLFSKLKPIQEKSLLSFIKLLLSSDEREEILTIIESVVNLTQEQRKNFVDILNKTALENILDMVKFIENRYIVINGLKNIIYKCEDYSNERNHIQKIIERNYWLFGENFNLVTADENMQKALDKYTNILYGESSNTNIEDISKFKRMDIFLTGKQRLRDPNDNILEENLIVELKAPKVKLTKHIVRQIEDYMDIIINEKEFNTQLKKWKFIVVCSNLDQDVKNMLKTFEDKGKNFLVMQLNNYEIYAMTWADVFKNFELSHSFMLDKLKYDCNKIQDIIEFETSDASRTLADEITERIVNIL